MSDQEIIIEDDDIHQSNDINEDESTAITMLDALLMPTSIQYMDFLTLSYYITINKLTMKMVNEKSFWIAVNNSFAFCYGLYTFCHNDLLNINAKKHFLQELLTAKHKFLSTTIDTTTTKSFNIKVCARFRPGIRSNNNVNLPLHQFLKVRRKNIKETEENNNNKCIVGEQDPEEFVDPLLGTLMNDPVLLKTSMKILDRSCAVKSILRGGRDPFNNRKLSLADLIPQPELAEKIRVWKEKKKNIDISISMNDVQQLGDSMASDPELLAILMEADRLSSLSKRAQLDARETVKSSEGHENNIENDSDDIIIEDEIENIISNYGTENTSENNENANSNILRTDNKLVNDNDDSQSQWKKNVESAKVVDINEKKACISMHLGGAGVRAFAFSCVNDASTTQNKMYQKGAQESVMAALNGFNACLLCYGQTGAGKTFTLFGPESGLDIDPQYFDYKGLDNSGIVIRATAELLDAKERMKSNDVNLSLSAQFVEIYNEEVVDLLNGRTCLLYTSPSPRDRTRSRMPSSA